MGMSQANGEQVQKRFNRLQEVLLQCAVGRWIAVLELRETGRGEKGRFCNFGIFRWRRWYMKLLPIKEQLQRRRGKRDRDLILFLWLFLPFTPEFPSEVETSVDPCAPHWLLLQNGDRDAFLRACCLSPLQGEAPLLAVQDKGAALSGGFTRAFSSAYRGTVWFLSKILGEGFWKYDC